MTDSIDLQKSADLLYKTILDDYRLLGKKPIYSDDIEEAVNVAFAGKTLSSNERNDLLKLFQDKYKKELTLLGHTGKSNCSH
ncbi:MAG: hypothetical protein ACMXYG_05905 [Candidatus Woesearchaeota archaeon]